MTKTGNSKFVNWWQSGSPWIWLNAGAVSASMIVVFGLLLLIAMRGMGHFWPADLTQIEYQGDNGVYRIFGEHVNTEKVSRIRYEESGGKAPQGMQEITRWLIKTGNRDLLGTDFRWIDAHQVQHVAAPETLVVVERVEWGNFYGYLHQVSEQQQVVASDQAAWAELATRLQRVRDLRGAIQDLENGELGSINYRLERLRLHRKKLALQGQDSQANLTAIANEEAALDVKYQGLRQQLMVLKNEINRDSAKFEMMDGRQIDIPLAKIVSVLQPNIMSVSDKLWQYIHNFKNFMLDDPREANTEGGVFPAIFGTVMMVMLMSILVTPMGVIAALYLREYAKQGPLIQIIRIAVNNLAGVPSIVYGVFGLGFFVYFLGGSIDQLFFPEVSPAPVFGTPGLLWASITLSLLTLPVVIVSTEEGLARIPKALREGSLALGATKFETIWKVVLPMASPAIMTGLILAIARAAGEVAPLMLVGVVKLAPELPLDENFPFMHVERKFMHLGFHIYDVGFQSPNVEAARPLVYATAFLLVLVIVMLNLSAIMLRNRLREKFKAFEH